MDSESKGPYNQGEGSATFSEKYLMVFQRRVHLPSHGGVLWYFSWCAINLLRISLIWFSMKRLGLARLLLLTLPVFFQLLPARAAPLSINEVQWSLREQGSLTSEDHVYWFFCCTS